MPYICIHNDTFLTCFFFFFFFSPLDNCNESAISDDYALPPDDNGPEAEAAIVAQSVAMLRISTLERHSDELEKSGYLTKLSGKLKTWRKRWFVLKNGTLSYWKSQVR